MKLMLVHLWQVYLLSPLIVQCNWVDFLVSLRVPCSFTPTLRGQHWAHSFGDGNVSCSLERVGVGSTLKWTLALRSR